MPTFLEIAFNIKCNSFASCHNILVSSFNFGTAVAIILSQYFVSLASFLQIPILCLKSLPDSASSASQ